MNEFIRKANRLKLPLDAPPAICKIPGVDDEYAIKSRLVPAAFQPSHTQPHTNKPCVPAHTGHMAKEGLVHSTFTWYTSPLGHGHR